MTRAANATFIRARYRLGIQLRRARRRRCWTQRDVATHTGLSLSTVRRCERGDWSVALSNVLGCAMVLGQLRAFNRLLECWAGQSVPYRSGCKDLQAQGVAHSVPASSAPPNAGYSPPIHSCRAPGLNEFAVSAQASTPSFAARVLQLASNPGVLEMLPERRAALGKEGLLQIGEAVLAFEHGRAGHAQLNLLLSCATALAGSRAKCYWTDENRVSCIAKFSSDAEGLSLNRAEALTMRMARMAGIDALDVRLLDPIRTPILVATRLGHLPCGFEGEVLSARRLLCVKPNDAVDLPALLDLMRVHVHADHFADDARQLWLRLVFMRLIHHPGDYLRKFDLVSDGEGRMRLAPACGLRVQTGPVSDLIDDRESGPGLQPTASALLTSADAFGIEMAQACVYLRRQVTALSQWKSLASHIFVNMSTWDIGRLEVPMSNAWLMGTRMQQSAYRLT